MCQRLFTHSCFCCNKFLSHIHTPITYSFHFNGGREKSIILAWLRTKLKFCSIWQSSAAWPRGPIYLLLQIKKKKILQYPPLPKYLIWISVFITKFSILGKKNFLRKRNLLGDLVLWSEYLLLWSLKQHRFLICD